MARIWDYRPVYENNIAFGDLNYGIDFDSMHYFLESYFSQFEDSINLMEVLSTVIEDNNLILTKNSNNKEQKSTEAKKAQKKSFKEKILKFIQSCKNAIINAFKFCVEKLSKFGAFIKRKAHEFKNIYTGRIDFYMPPFKKKEFFNYSKDIDLFVAGVRATINNDMSKPDPEFGEKIHSNLLDIFKKSFNIGSNEEFTEENFAESFVRHYIDSSKEERVTISFKDLERDYGDCMKSVNYNRDYATKALNEYIKNCDKILKNMGSETAEFKQMKKYGEALSIATTYTSKSFTASLRIYEWYFTYLKRAIEAIEATYAEYMYKHGRNPDGTKKQKSDEKSTKESFGFSY